MNLNLTRWLLILTLFVSVTSGCQVFQGGTMFEKDRPVFYDPVFESLSRTGETPDSSFHPDVRRSLPAEDSDSETQWALPGAGSVSSLRTNLESGGSRQTTSDEHSPGVSPEIHQESEPGPFSRNKDFVTTQYRVANPLEEKLWGGPSGLDIILSDQKRFYSRENFRPFALTLGISAIVANTSIDQEFADWYQDDVRSESTDDFSRIAKSFGEQWPMVGAYLTASALGRLPIADTRLAIWGDRSFRSMLVGVPPLLFLQKALGSSRPNDVPAFSDWRFWEDENGASGHTFVGAVPFLVAAQLARRPSAKFGWTVASTLPGWSRINDNDHYLSQVIVGWYLAYLATQSVQETDAELGVQIVPMRIGNTPGIGIEWNF